MNSHPFSPRSAPDGIDIEPDDPYTATTYKKRQCRIKMSTWSEVEKRLDTMVNQGYETPEIKRMLCVPLALDEQPGDPDDGIVLRLSPIVVTPLPLNM